MRLLDVASTFCMSLAIAPRHGERDLARMECKRVSCDVDGVKHVLPLHTRKTPPLGLSRPARAPPLRPTHPLGACHSRPVGVASRGRPRARRGRGAPSRPPRRACAQRATRVNPAPRAPPRPRAGVPGTVAEQRARARRGARPWAPSDGRNGADSGPAGHRPRRPIGPMTAERAHFFNRLGAARAQLVETRRGAP